MNFRCKWTLWEHYESQGEKLDYAASMCKTCWFNDMISFVTAWSTIPHSDLANIFYNEETKTCKIVNVGTLPVRISGLSLFQSQISPEWEDPQNKNGGQFRIDFKSHLPFLQNIWDKLVFSIVTDAFDGADMISGVRLLDKSSSSRENIFRIEIWTKFDSSQSAMVESLREHLENEYIQLMIEDQYTRPNNIKVNEQVAAEWLSNFSNNQKDESNKGGNYPSRGGHGGRQ